MRHLWLFSVAASASLGFCGEAAAEPLVIPGIGPENAPVYAAPPAAAPRARSGGYGGGFLELLITGRDPTRGSAAVTNRPPEPQARSAHCRATSAAGSTGFLWRAAAGFRRRPPLRRSRLRQAGSRL